MTFTAVGRVPGRRPGPRAGGDHRTLGAGCRLAVEGATSGSDRLIRGRIAFQMSITLTGEPFDTMCFYVMFLLCFRMFYVMFYVFDVFERFVRWRLRGDL